MADQSTGVDWGHNEPIGDQKGEKKQSAMVYHHVPLKIVVVSWQTHHTVFPAYLSALQPPRVAGLAHVGAQAWDINHWMI